MTSAHNLGDNITLYCDKRPQNASTDAQPVWYMNSELLDSNIGNQTFVVDDKEQALHIYNFSRNNVGYYQCQFKPGLISHEKWITLKHTGMVKHNYFKL